MKNHAIKIISFLSSAKLRSFKMSTFYQRPNPSHPNSLPIPEHSGNCLEGYTFAATGVGISMTREEVIKLVEDCGATTLSTYSPKTKMQRVTTFLRGEQDPSDPKVEDARKRGIEIMDEKGLIERIINNTMYGPGHEQFIKPTHSFERRELEARGGKLPKPRKPRDTSVANKESKVVKPKDSTKPRINKKAALAAVAELK